MKREPDRLDFLIVILPVLLVGLLGFQAYEYIQMNRQRVATQPLSSEESAAAPGGQEPESPQAAPTEGEAGDAEAPSADVITDDPDTTDSAEEEPALETGEPAAADADPPAQEASPPVTAGTEPEAEAPAADAVPMPGEPDAVAPAPDEAAAVAEAEVLLVPQNNPAKVGELITVDVVIREASGVSGVNFHLRYNQTLLQLNEDPQSVLGPFLEDPDGGTRFNAMALANGKVVVSINLAQGAEGRSGQGRLATFYFQVLAPGETRLDLLQSVLHDASNSRLPAVFSNATLIIVE